MCVVILTVSHVIPNGILKISVYMMIHTFGETIDIIHIGFCLVDGTGGTIPVASRMPL